MGGYKRVFSAVGGDRVVAGFGVTYVALAAVKVYTVLRSGGTLTAAAVDFALIGVPGIVLVFGANWLRRSELPARLLYRTVAWCLGGFVTILLIIELVNLEPGVIIVHLFWTNVLATGIGTVIGFALGVNDARAVSRAREVETVNRKLQRANAELERQNDRLESFASVLAHELRNPLSIAEIYLPRVGDDESAREEVAKALERIEEMIEVLFVTARKVNTDIDSEPVSLADAAVEAWEDLRVESATLVVETEQTVRANPIHLRHLLENLFKNSVEHAGSDVTTRVGDLPSGFYVEDDGPGIPESERERVFDAGYTTGGIGFGLAFVSRLSDAYDWDCTVTEGTDGGARFEFTGIEVASSKDPQRN